MPLLLWSFALFAVVFAQVGKRVTLTCNPDQIICGGQCIPATSNCCQGGSSCGGGGTCYTPPVGGISCCVPGAKCAGAGGTTVIAPPQATCSGSTPNICGNTCLGVGANCCPGGSFCSGGGTCYPVQGGYTCCIPGMNCVALGGVTVAAVPTAQETQTVSSIAVVTSTAPTTSIATTTEINIVTYTASATMVSSSSLASSSSSASTTSTVSSIVANSGPTTVTVSATSADNTVPAAVTVGASAATGSSTKSSAAHVWINDNRFSFVSWLNVCTMFVILNLLLR